MERRADAVKPVHIDVCSGVGMFGIAAHYAGFETKAFCEINTYCQKVLARHFPGAYIHGNLQTLTGNTLRRYDIEHIALLTGGFPCQDLSCAGKGAGLNGARSGLWFDMLRLITETRPLFVVIENVPALKTRGADIVLAGLEAAGYTSEAFVVGAWAAGAPHERNRVWIVAYASGLSDAQAHTPARAFGSQRQARDYDGGSSGKRLPGTHRPILEPSLGGGPDGPPPRLDELRWPAAPRGSPGAWEPAKSTAGCLHHAERMKAIGNGIVWPIAACIFSALKELIE